MHVLKRLTFAALALVALAGSSPASAQYFPPDISPGYEDPQDGYQRRHRHHYEPRYQEPRYVQPEEPYYQPRARVGYTCWTRRGTCELGDGQALNSICKCYIPGFGPKRGYTRP